MNSLLLYWINLLFHIFSIRIKWWLTGQDVVSKNSIDAQAYEHGCSPNDGSKNQLKIIFIPR